MAEKDQITTFDGAMQALLLELDARLGELVAACEDWRHLDAESGEMAQIRRRLDQVVADIFALKQARAVAGQYARMARGD